MAAVTMKSEARSIGGVKYETTQFLGRAGLMLQARLLRAVGPALGGVVGAGLTAAQAASKQAGGNAGVFAALLAANVDPKDVAGALMGLANVDPPSFVALVLDLLAQTQAGEDGMIDEQVFDTHFPACWGNLYPLLLFVIQVNFGSLFGAGGIGGLTAKLGTAAKRGGN